jgi:tetratricopeptide (TPR) repeat protein
MPEDVKELSAAAAKEKGVEAFKQESDKSLEPDQKRELLATALECFSQCVALEPEDHIHWSNRAAVHTKLLNFKDALVDAKKCTDLKPDFAKGWARIGVANVSLSKLEDAEKAFQHGLKLEPGNVGCLNGIKDVEKARSNPAKRERKGIIQQAFNPLGLSLKGWLLYFACVVAVVSYFAKRKLEAALEKQGGA